MCLYRRVHVYVMPFTGYGCVCATAKKTISVRSRSSCCPSKQELNIKHELIKSGRMKPATPFKVIPFYLAHV